MTNEERDLLQREAGKTPTVQMQEYLCDFEKRQKKSNVASLVFTIIGVVASTIAAITGLLLLFQ